MIWQDAVFAAGGAFFCLALLPLIRNPEARVPRKTSIPTGLFIGLFALTHFSLGLYWATFTESCSALSWAWIAWRKATDQTPQRLVLHEGQNLDLVPPGQPGQAVSQRHSRRESLR